MQTNSVNVSSATLWRELYLAALFENDERKRPSRIVAAEKALLLRARQLFGGQGGEEAKAVEKGLYAMWALRQCHHLKARSAYLDRLAGERADAG